VAAPRLLRRRRALALDFVHPGGEPALVKPAGEKFGELAAPVRSLLRHVGRATRRVFGSSHIFGAGRCLPSGIAHVPVGCPAFFIPASAVRPVTVFAFGLVVPANFRRPRTGPLGIALPRARSGASAAGASGRPPPDLSASCAASSHTGGAVEAFLDFTRFGYAAISGLSLIQDPTPAGVARPG
jgi:hypothetical protein